MLKQYRTIKGTKYLYWNKYYWLPLKEFKCGCGRKLTKYKKFRKWKGELKEVRQGNSICPSCQVSY
ncbi:hypothetical protein [endosymbiont GvMRE of Glomus versiforme]|uniref:hypothetical protein n=1 Tax=endosymbiont GvMRE of Glomus versiforme TaxID=2039283 RepID=UPI000EBC22E3|nr:hypothetical protein [endosymbiont GvMRE of Glomus versiforme]RHZ36318.1 hypothetical protein GvMRE_Ic1g43 [endosymbiont GvMRE of Glomus versiforme]RHZ37721.1 hypothetical protein GvMRE_I1g685 [endosymbiont GvMRE of Glomus versiforme]